MLNRVICFASLALLSISNAYAGGVAMGATRVIYNASEKEATITVKNKGSEHNYLVQSWVEDNKGNKDGSFIVTPPLFTLPSNKESVLRIVRTGGALPHDRETVYWLSVKAIPPKGENNGNSLQLAIKTRMKLFYRPDGLQGKPSESPEKLRWGISGNNLTVINDTPYSVTLTNVYIGGKKVENTDLVPAKGNASFPLPKGATGKNVTFKTINDFGGVSDNITHPVVKQE
ncbi:fimbrial biogenesis chaperone [Enterobacter hormaechei subsp. xiangfangensis]|uniref:fimbrial biogenesis chaperone n=1 Tax=Enterobacter hormaechei TaxID=158836 RepID=UPI003F42CF30